MSDVRAVILLPLTCSVILLALVMTSASAQKNLDPLTQSNLESLEDVQDLIRKVQLIFEMKVASKVRQGIVPDGGNYVDLDLNGCGCSGGKCYCCLYLSYWMFFLYGDCCVNVAYHPHNQSILFTLTFKSWVLFKHEISAKHPPQICHHFPFMEKGIENRVENGVGGCIEFYDIQITSSSFNMCFKLLLQVFRRTIYTINLHCIHFNFRNADQHEATHYMDGGAAPFGRPDPSYLGEILMGKKKHGDKK